jgi:cysteine-rich repeat protein
VGASAGGVPLTGIKTDNGACSSTPCQIVVATAQSVTWHFPVSCGNSRIDAGETCDDGDAQSGDGCSASCAVEGGYSCTGTPSVCTALPSAGSGTLTINVRRLSLSGTKSGSGGDLSIPLLAFDATASGDTVTIKRLSFVAAEGSLTSLTNYKLWEDTNGDGTVDRPASTAISPSSGLLTFAPSAWTGAVIGSGSTIVYELRGDVPATLSGTNIRLAFDTAASDYVGATQLQNNAPLLGVRTDGICAAGTCQIIVATHTTTLWSFKGCPDGVVQAGETCDDGDAQSGDGCSAVCAVETGYTCTGTPSVCTALPSAGSGTLDITVLTLPADASGSGGDLSIPLLAFQATAGGDTVTINRLSFRAEAGSLSTLTNYRLWEDITGDGIVDRPISAVIGSAQDLLTFAPSAWTGAVIGSGSTINYELRADVPEALSGTTIRIAFDIAASDYVGASQLHDAAPLLGVRTDGTCSAGTCMITVITRGSTLWSLKGCGDNLIQAGEQCDEGQNNGQPTFECDDWCSIVPPIPDF